MLKLLYFASEIGGCMSDESEFEYSIAIEFKNFITRYDLDEILTSIDGIIELELIDLWGPEWIFSRRYFGPFFNTEKPTFSYLGIESVNSGSIIITVVTGAAVLAYVVRRFKKGVDKSLLAEELERSGRLSGDLIGHALHRINNWAERYVPKQREAGGNVTGIKVERKPRAKRKRPSES